MRDRHNLGDEGFGNRRLVDQQHPGVADDMGTGENQPRFHQEARTGAGLWRLHAPRGIPVRTLLVVRETHHRLLHRLRLAGHGVQGGRNSEESKEEGEAHSE